MKRNGIMNNVKDLAIHIAFIAFAFVMGYTTSKKEIVYTYSDYLIVQDFVESNNGDLENMIFYKDSNTGSIKIESDH